MQGLCKILLGTLERGSTGGRALLKNNRCESSEGTQGLAEPRPRVWSMEGLLRRLCRDPALLRDYRRDPMGTARRGGVLLAPEHLAHMRDLEEDAVTDVVLHTEGGES